MNVTIQIPDSLYEAIKRYFSSKRDSDIEALLSRELTELLQQRIENQLPKSISQKRFHEILKNAPDLPPREDDEL